MKTLFSGALMGAVINFTTELTPAAWKWWLLVITIMFFALMAKEAQS